MLANTSLSDHHHPRLSAETGQPVSFAMLQVSSAPELWKDLLQASIDAIDEGADIHPQVAGRPFGVLVGWETGHPFLLRPSYQAIAHLPIAERIVELRKPETRTAILGESDSQGTGLLIEGLSALAAGMLGLGRDKLRYRMKQIEEAADDGQDREENRT